MLKEENIKVVQTFWDRLNAHQVEFANELRADDGYEAYVAVGQPMNKEQDYQFDLIFEKAFPDIQFEIVHMIADGDLVVTNWIVSGTHTGVLAMPGAPEIPPTGKKGNLMGSTTLEIKDGKMQRGWASFDNLQLMGQLGLM